MARPGQTASRKRRVVRADDSSYAGDSDDGGGGGGDGSYKGSQVLPVAELSDDWDGEILDGATYLGVASRANARLPAYKSVPNPYAVADVVFPASSSTDLQEDNVAGPSKVRHPALPRESWEVLFPIHFMNYKKHLLSSWPPSPLPPYPIDHPRIPNFHDKFDLMYYINGYPRARIKLPINEEELMNLASSPAATSSDPKSLYGPEPEGSRHRPREPTLSVLSRFGSRDAQAALGRISMYLHHTLAAITPTLRLPDQYADVSDNEPQNDQMGNLLLQDSENGSINGGDQASNLAKGKSPAAVHETPNPLSSHLARWIFALILIVDLELSGSEISTLRELARVVMRVAGWRWVEGVTSGELKEGHVLGQSRKNRLDDVSLSTSPILPPNGHSLATIAIGTNDPSNGRNTSSEAVPQRNEANASMSPDDVSVDETLARCWMIVYAIAAGWGQKDLVEDIVQMFT